MLRRGCYLNGSITLVGGNVILVLQGLDVHAKALVVAHEVLDTVDALQFKLHFGHSLCEVADCSCGEVSCITL